MVYGAAPPYALEPEIFWKTSVADYLQMLRKIPQEQHIGKKT